MPLRQWQVNINGFIRCQKKAIRVNICQRSSTITAIQSAVYRSKWDSMVSMVHSEWPQHLNPPYRTPRKKTGRGQAWPKVGAGNTRGLAMITSISPWLPSTCGRLDCRGQSILKGILRPVMFLENVREFNSSTPRCHGTFHLSTWKAIWFSWMGSQLVIWWGECLHLGGLTNGASVFWGPAAGSWHITSRSKLRLHGRHDIITMYGPRTNVNYQIIIYYNIEKYIYYNIKR